MSFLSKLFPKGPATYTRRYVTQSAQEKANAELERDSALAGITDSNRMWQAVLSLVDEHAQGENEGALSPGLTNEQRQYAAGAAASADYLAKMLRDARTMAAQRMAKAKQSDE